MRTRPLASKSVAFTVAILFAIAPIHSATHFVSVNGSGFSPSSLNIEVGDDVVWTNDDPNFPHTTTSTLPFSNPDYWTFTLVDYEDTFSKAFNNVGTFNYVDLLDIGTGSITVSPVAPPPVITLANPRVEKSEFLFDASGLTISKTNLVEMSTNLVDWIPVSTNIADAGSMTFTNALNPGTHLFRVLEQP